MAFLFPQSQPWNRAQLSLHVSVKDSHKLFSFSTGNRGALQDTTNPENPQLLPQQEMSADRKTAQMNVGFLPTLMLCVLLALCV